jgi:hypothetical protein
VVIRAPEEIKRQGLSPTKPEMAKAGRGAVGGLAQLARAIALQAIGRRFDSDILHREKVSNRESNSQ